MGKPIYKDIESIGPRPFFLRNDQLLESTGQLLRVPRHTRHTTALAPDLCCPLRCHAAANDAPALAPDQFLSFDWLLWFRLCSHAIILSYPDDRRKFPMTGRLVQKYHCNTLVCPYN